VNKYIFKNLHMPTQLFQINVTGLKNYFLTFFFANSLNKMYNV